MPPPPCPHAAALVIGHELEGCAAGDGCGVLCCRHSNRPYCAVTPPQSGALRHNAFACAPHTHSRLNESKSKPVC